MAKKSKGTRREKREQRKREREEQEAAAQEAAAGEKSEVLLGQGSLNCTVNACNMGGNDDGKNV